MYSFVIMYSFACVCVLFIKSIKIGTKTADLCLHNITFVCKCLFLKNCGKIEKKEDTYLHAG
jgi:hypothetical protein